MVRLAGMRKRKLVGRRKKTYRKRPLGAIARAVRQSHRIKYFTEFFQASDVAVSTSQIGGNFNVQLASLPNHAQFVNLFDQFCIIKFEVHLLQKMGAMNNNVGGIPLTFITAVNRDGATATGLAATPAQILAEDNSRVYNLLGNRGKIVIKVPNPKPYLLEYQGDSIVSTSIPINEPLRKWKWLDTSRGQNVNYYGINWVLDNPSVLEIPVFDVFYKVTIACKEQQ